MPFINCKVELNLNWKMHCVLDPGNIVHPNANFDNVTFTIKDTKLYVLVFTLSAKDYQKLSSSLDNRNP